MWNLRLVQYNAQNIIYEKLIVLVCCLQKQGEREVNRRHASYAAGRKKFNDVQQLNWIMVRREYIIPVCQHKVQSVSPLFKIAKMIVRIVFEMVILLALFKAADGAASSLTNNLPSGCNCQPVVKLSVDGNSDLCKGNNQLLQEINDLKKQLTTITDQLRQIIPQPGEKSVSSAHFFIEKICKQFLALRIL